MSLKKIHEVSLKDVILLDATKSAKHLKNDILPIRIYRKDLEGLVKEIFDLIGERDVVDELQDNFDRLLSYRNIRLLEALYKLVIIELRLKQRVNVWKIIADKEITESSQINEVLAEVLKYTGIDIKAPEDVTVLNEYIQYRVDKHKEMYPDKIQDEETEPVSIIRVFYSVFSFMGEKYDENMRLLAFIEMKKMAEEKVRQSKNTDNGSFE